MHFQPPASRDEYLGQMFSLASVVGVDMASVLDLVEGAETRLTCGRVMGSRLAD